MDKWEEEEEALHISPSQLIMHNRFIDDLIIFWDGSERTLKTFLWRMNQNNKNITLTWEFSYMKIHFLDLEITNENNKIITKTQFKATDIHIFHKIVAAIHHGW